MTLENIPLTDTNSAVKGSILTIKDAKFIAVQAHDKSQRSGKKSLPLPFTSMLFPSTFAPSHHDRANHSSHDTQHPRHEIIRHLREKSIKPQREKYSGKKVHAHHTVK